MSKYISIEKSKLTQVPISEFADFITNNFSGSKTEFLVNSIENWIKQNFGKTIHANDLMPPKSLMADLLDISVGTVQNVYKQLENKGLLYSKQRIGTLIADINKKDVTLRKSGSKSEMAEELIKVFIKKNKFKNGDVLPSVRTVAKYINTPVNTTGIAMQNLVNKGYIEKIKKKECIWVLANSQFQINLEKPTDLVAQVAGELKEYIYKNFKAGDLLPSHLVLAKLYKVSAKTIFSAIKLLTEEGILMPKRGRYGTCVIKVPDDSGLQPSPETSIFATSQTTSKYHYLRVYDTIKNLIINKYSVHSKIPSIVEMANFLDINPNTVRKAYSKLFDEGYLETSRGRYGGTYVKKIPETTADKPYEWVSVNPDFSGWQ